MTLVAGVDGAREEGWVLVRLRAGRLDAIAFAPQLEQALREARDCDAVLVDVPIGHDDPDGVQGGARAADAAAQTYLTGAASTIFRIPPPPVYAATDYEAARRLCETRGWPKPSKQAWHLGPRIQEAEAAAAADARLREGHPEVSFRKLLAEHGGGDQLRASKHTFDGFMGRLELLHAAGLRPSRSFGGLGRVGPDDVLDATILAWSAQRLAQGRALTLPANPPPDPRTGRPVAIWY
jgi:predicted RNase H-like nuclease